MIKRLYYIYSIYDISNNFLILSFNIFEKYGNKVNEHKNFFK